MSDSKGVFRCLDCGGSYYDDGTFAGCPLCALSSAVSQLATSEKAREEATEQFRKEVENSRRLHALNETFVGIEKRAEKAEAELATANQEMGRLRERVGVLGGVVKKIETKTIGPYDFVDLDDCTNHLAYVAQIAISALTPSQPEGAEEGQ